MMELSLQNEQKQIMSQKMIQSVQVLQMTATQLDSYLTEQSLENPVLELTAKEPERAESRELEKYQWICSHDEQNRYLYQKMENEDEFPEWNMDLEEPENLAEHLWSQILGSGLTGKQEEAVRYMLECLDARGYFIDEPETVAKKFGISAEDVEMLIGKIQKLDPAGIGARSLQECLMLQLERKGELTEALKTLIGEDLKLVAENQLPQIAKKRNCSLDEVKALCAQIRELDPRPGALYSDVRRPQYVEPDVVVVKFEDHFEILLNDALCPDISLNATYVNMCSENQDKEVVKYLMGKIHQVEWIRQCVAQRNETLRSVTGEIVRQQEAFFQKGLRFLKPLKMSDVADELEIHESTVSRAVSNKYLQCSWGMFRMRQFFAAAVNSEFTNDQIKEKLKELIAGEPEKKPYSDRVLSELLEQHGMMASRRTVAKYRDEMGIPGTTGRKQY